MASSQNQQQQQQQGGQEDHALRERKQAVRKAIKAALQQMPQDAMQAESASIAAHVLKAPFFTQCQRLGVYVHCAKLREVDTSSLVHAALAAGKRCYVPVVADQQSNMKLLHLDALSSLVPVPPFGILEPPPMYADATPRPDALDEDQPLEVLLMPGLGFDTSGNRLGRGGGYYDKTLARLREQARKAGAAPPLLVGLAYSTQVVPEVPVGAYDMQVDILVTAEKVHDFRERKAAH